MPLYNKKEIQEFEVAHKDFIQRLPNFCTTTKMLLSLPFSDEKKFQELYEKNSELRDFYSDLEKHFHYILESEDYDSKTKKRLSDEKLASLKSPTERIAKEKFVEKPHTISIKNPRETTLTQRFEALKNQYKNAVMQNNYGNSSALHELLAKYAELIVLFEKHAKNLLEITKRESLDQPNMRTSFLGGSLKAKMTANYNARIEIRDEIKKRFASELGKKSLSHEDNRQLTKNFEDDLTDLIKLGLSSDNYRETISAQAEEIFQRHIQNIEKSSTPPRP